jgi:site-specific DNA-methyltransferase (cytosine-N4-specific)
MHASQQRISRGADLSERPALSGLTRLEQVDWAFSGSTKRHFTHDLHPWPAKFIPDIPATAIDAFTQPGDTVLDPFCGCGTAAVEARVSGRAFIALDVNPLATMLTAGKCEVPNGQARTAIRRWDSMLIVDTAAPHWLPPIPNFDYWFDSEVAAQLAALLRAIESYAGSPEFLRSVFASIIVRVSRQESETRYRRVNRDVSAAKVLNLFSRRLELALNMAEDLERHCAGDAPRRYLTADARDLADVVDRESAQLAVFSPPYPNAFDYHLYHRFRMFWLGTDPRLVKHKEIGAHLRYEPKEAWEADMARVFCGLTHALASRGHVLCVVGDGVVRGEIVKSADVLWKVAKEAGLTPVWRRQRPLSAHRRAFNLADTRLREEHVLVFRR